MKAHFPNSKSYFLLSSQSPITSGDPLIISISSHDNAPTKEASAARKRLLDAFGQYDRLSKKIRALPCPNGPGSSQDRVQRAVLTRTNNFLQKNMFPLQVGRRYFWLVCRANFDRSRCRHHREGKGRVFQPREVRRNRNPILF